MAQDSFAILVAPCSQAEAEAGTNNDKPVTPLRAKQAAEARIEGGDFTIACAANDYVVYEGVSRGAGQGTYRMTIGDDGGLPGINSNAYICLNGPSTATPLEVAIAGQASYMLGINSDVGVDPTIVVKTSGDVIAVYNGADTLIARWDEQGYMRCPRFIVGIPGGTTGTFEINDASEVALNRALRLHPNLSIGADSAATDSTFRHNAAGLLSHTYFLTDGDTDEKNWTWQAGAAIGSGVLRLRCVNDAISNGINAVVFTRDAVASVTTDFQAGPVGFTSYTVAGLPSASTAGRMVYVSNESGGAVMAFSDGTNWRRVTDRAIVS